MARLFITLYAGIIGSVFIFLVVLDLFATGFAYDVDEQDQQNTLMGYVTLLSELQQLGGDELMLSTMKQVAGMNEMIASEVTEPHILADPRIKALPSPGGTTDSLDLEAGDPDYFKLAFGQRVFRVGDDPDSELWAKQRLIESVSLWGILIIIALILGAWLFYLHRKLTRLEVASGRIASGDFSARVADSGVSRVGGLNRAFNDMAERIEQLMASHKRLTNAVAHELRTPMFRIRCQLELLEQGADKAEFEQFVQGMEADLEELDVIVDELLTFARMERADIEVNPQPTDLPQWIEQQLPTLKRTASLPLTFAGSDLDSLSSQAFTAPVDVKLMQRALTNLVSNADKYGQQAIQISLQQADDRVSLCVDDDGPGIPPSERERVLEPFERIDSARARKTGGYGLGLAIVREIVAHHQGQVIIETSPLGGARLRIELPLCKTDKS